MRIIDVSLAANQIGRRLQKKGQSTNMLKQQIQQKREEGFTLIELLIVIIILAVLAAIVVFAVGSTSSNAKVAACNSDAKSVETALEAYKAQTGSFPVGLPNLTASTVNGASTTGPWLRQVPRATMASDGYVISYGSGQVTVTTGSTTANYDSSSNPCDTAG